MYGAALGATSDGDVLGDNRPGLDNARVGSATRPDRPPDRFPTASRPLPDRFPTASRPRPDRVPTAPGPRPDNAKHYLFAESASMWFREFSVRNYKFSWGHHFVQPSIGYSKWAQRVFGSCRDSTRSHCGGIAAVCGHMPRVLDLFLRATEPSKHRGPRKRQGSVETPPG